MTNYVLIHGDCLEQLRGLPSDSVDSLVTDPPAGIAFMGKEWDEDKGGRKQWVAWMTEVMAEALRVLKPGAHGLVWALPRTSHWTATALEDAGFEIRDVVTHLFGQGFPKSLDISKAIDKAAGAEREVVGKNPNHRSDAGKVHATGTMCGEPHTGDGSITAPATDDAKTWSGWGTALKPASEHWILVRKPCSEKTVAANVLKWGVGGVNIDGCRIGDGQDRTGGGIRKASQAGTDTLALAMDQAARPTGGRFPANLVLDEEAAAALDAQTKHTRAGKPAGTGKSTTNRGVSLIGMGGVESTAYSDSGGASRFFYCAKVSPSERGEDNKHPTVKPQKLMRYLIRLITPPGGVVLDPFTGSGSTGVAAITEGFLFIGIEKENEYASIAETRLEVHKSTITEPV